MLTYFAQLARLLPHTEPAADYHFLAGAETAAWLTPQAPLANVHVVGWDDAQRALRLMSEHMLIGRWLARNDADILFMANAGASPLCLPRDVKLIQAIFAFHQFTAGEASPLRSFYRRSLFGRAVRRADRILLNSRYSERLLEDRAPDAVTKVTNIPHGIDPALFHPGSIDVADRAALLRHGLVEPYFLFVGQMYPYKGAEIAAAAFARFAVGNDRHQLVMIGRFDHRFSAGERYRAEILRAAGDAANRILLIDALPVGLLRAAYRGAIAYLQPSRAETFGKTTLESMACGCPVIAADSGATPEVLGGAGLLFPPDDMEACATGMRRFTHEPRLACSLAARGLAQASGRTIAAEATALARLFAAVAR